MEAAAKSGDRRAKRTLAIIQNLAFYLSGTQLGITVSSLVLGYVVQPTIGSAIAPLVDRLPWNVNRQTVTLAVALVLATSFQMVLGELVPKGVAIAHPLGVAQWLSGLLSIYGRVFGFVFRFLNAAAFRTVRMFGIEPVKELSNVRTLEEIDLLIAASGRMGTLDSDAAELLARSIRFGQKSASDALIPRGAVVGVKARDSLATLASVALETGFSRFPVFGRDVHDVLGTVHAKDVFKVSVDRRATTPVTEVMTEATVIPESRELESLLLEMRAGGNQLAVVVDEFGSTAGIITLEDMLEEIVGEIDDEHDTEHETPTSGGDRLIVDGGLHHDEVLQVAAFEMPEGDFKTLAGFLLTLFERIPEVGDVATFHDWRFEVVEMDGHRIAAISVSPPPETRVDEQ